MISFWVPAAESFGIELWLARRVPELTDRFDIRHYESLTADQEIVGGAHIFTGLDRPLSFGASFLPTSCHLHQVLQGSASRTLIGVKFVGRHGE